MTVEEAYSNFKKKHSDLVILSCYEYDSCFVFQAVAEGVAKDRKNMVFDSLYSVSKKDGSLTLFKPFDISEEEYNRGRKLPVEKFDVKMSELSKPEREVAMMWLDKRMKGG